MSIVLDPFRAERAPSPKKQHNSYIIENITVLLHKSSLNIYALFEGVIPSEKSAKDDYISGPLEKDLHQQRLIEECMLEKKLKSMMTVATPAAVSPGEEMSPISSSSQHRSFVGKHTYIRGFTKSFHSTFNRLLSRPHISTSIISTKTKDQPKQQLHSRPVPKVMLQGTETSFDHYAKVEELIRTSKGLKGRDGLQKLGFDYRLFPCSKHMCEDEIPKDFFDGKGTETEVEGDGMINEENTNVTLASADTKLNIKLCFHEEKKDDDNTLSSPPMPSIIPEQNQHKNVKTRTRVDKPCNKSSHKASYCSDCCTRLYHVHTQTPINEDNRKRFVADGQLYECVARLCQEYAQDVMRVECDLEWVTVDNKYTKGKTQNCNVGGEQGTDDNNDELVKMMVSRQWLSSTTQHHCSNRPLLLVSTGKGKVRAGVFSRKHLMTGGLECSTALHVLRDAKSRGMHVAIPDPNAKGDCMGMDTYSKSLDFLLSTFAEKENGMRNNGVSEGGGNIPIYILAHSASGAQLIRYLMNQALCLEQESEQDSEQYFEPKLKTKPQATLQLLSKSELEPESFIPLNTQQHEKHLKDKLPGQQHQQQQQQNIQLQQQQQNDKEKKLSPSRMLLPKIHSVVFTDSTHNVQWLQKKLPIPLKVTKKKVKSFWFLQKKVTRSQEIEKMNEYEIDNDRKKKNYYGKIAELIQCNKSSLYVRSADKYRDEGWEHKVAGDFCFNGSTPSKGNPFWVHRFGTVHTVWAGTSEHSLSNWTARCHIWEHFDKCSSSVTNC